MKCRVSSPSIGAPCHRHSDCTKDLWHEYPRYDADRAASRARRGNARGSDRGKGAASARTFEFRRTKAAKEVADMDEVILRIRFLDHTCIFVLWFMAIFADRETGGTRARIRDSCVDRRTAVARRICCYRGTRLVAMQ